MQAHLGGRRIALLINELNCVGIAMQRFAAWKEKLPGGRAEKSRSLAWAAA